MKSELKIKILLFSHLKYALGKDYIQLTMPEESTFADLEIKLWKIVGNRLPKSLLSLLSMTPR